MLRFLPDAPDESQILPWVASTLSRITNASFSGACQAIEAPHGSAPDWNKFVLAAFTADWACYTEPSDRVEYARMHSVVSSFPQGFRVYFAKSGDEWLPVGYTGWYPIAAETFQVLHEAPQKITHRGMIKPVSLTPEKNYLYLFNYSIAPALIGTEQSRSLIKDFARSLEDVPVAGLCAITVSSHGVRVAEKFGMKHAGNITHDGVPEGAYTFKIL